MGSRYVLFFCGSHLSPDFRRDVPDEAEYRPAAQGEKSRQQQAQDFDAQNGSAALNGGCFVMKLSVFGALAVFERCDRLGPAEDL